MTIDPEQQKSLFLTASDLAASERAAYLDHECGADANLRARVDALLAAHDAAGPLPQPADADVTLPGDAAAAAAPTTDGSADADPADEVSLAFLAASTRPDSLGRIGHYECLKVLGQGAFGIVFRAFDDVLRRIVAVKVLAPHMAATSPARKRFLREARSSAAVRHENVVQVYEVGDQPLPYIAMEYVPGETLQQRLDRTGPLDVRDLLQIGRQIAEGLAAAHATDLIHRDIKPGNILLEGAQQRVKITDFGLARAADDASISQSGVLAGTPMYMSPEQATGRTLDQRADLFSLGSVLYQMASGRPPFRANGTFAVLKRVAGDMPRPIREIIPEMPSWVCEIIGKLHAKDPNDRFQSAREVADVLADCEARIAGNARIGGFSHISQNNPSATATAGRWKWTVAAAVALPLLALAVTELADVTHLIRKGRPPPDPRGSANRPGEPASPATAAVVVATPLPPVNAGTWTVLKPIEMRSTGGATLSLQPDGSILATGTLAPQDVYTLTFRDLPPNVHALRLDVLPHASLPKSGPGRNEEGEFALTTFKCQAGPPGTTAGRWDVNLAKAWADNRRSEDSTVQLAIDAEDGTGWVTEVGKPHFAVFEFVKPVAAPDGTLALQVTLEFKHNDGSLSLGCFRLSAANEAIAGQ